jgi:hypothetical protein
MASETNDYAAFLARLEEQRNKIDAAISAVRELLNLEVEQAAGSPVSGSSVQRKEQPATIRFDSFFQMTMPDAVTKFLGMATIPQSVGEITKALEAGGFKTTAKNLMPSVGSTLSRMKSAGEVVSVKGKWGLAAWYPAARTLQTPANPNKARKRGRPKGSKARIAKTEAKRDAPNAEPKAPSSKPTPEQIEQIKKLHVTGKRPGEIAKEVGLHHLAVWSILKPPKAA